MKLPEHWGFVSECHEAQAGSVMNAAHSYWESLNFPTSKEYALTEEQQGQISEAMLKAFIAGANYFLTKEMPK